MWGRSMRYTEKFCHIGQIFVSIILLLHSSCSCSLWLNVIIIEKSLGIDDNIKANLSSSVTKGMRRAKRWSTRTRIMAMQIIQIKIFKLHIFDFKVLISASGEMYLSWSYFACYYGEPWSFIPHNYI